MRTRWRRCFFGEHKNHWSWNISTSERSVKLKTNQITSFHIHIKRNLKHFDNYETVEIYSIKNYINTNIIKINLDNQPYLNQLYENHTRFFNISPIRESLLNQLSETATAVREILLSQYTIGLAHTIGFLSSILLTLRIIVNKKFLSLRIFIFALLTFSTIYFILLFVLNLNVFWIFARLFFVNLNVKFSWT